MWTRPLPQKRSKKHVPKEKNTLQMAHLAFLLTKSLRQMFKRKRPMYRQDFQSISTTGWWICCCLGLEIQNWWNPKPLHFQRIACRSRDVKKYPMAIRWEKNLLHARSPKKEGGRSKESLTHEENDRPEAQCNPSAPCACHRKEMICSTCRLFRNIP